MRSGLLLRISELLLLAVAGAHGQNTCGLDLANQSDGATTGVILSLMATADSSGNCQLSAVKLALSVGGGASLKTLDASFAWQTGVVYTATAVITAAGPQQLSLNGQPMGSLPSAFQPTAAILLGSNVDGSGTAAQNYVVTQISLRLANGSNTVSEAPNGSNPDPLPLVLMSGPAVWPVAFTGNPAQPLTITATFRFDPLPANPQQQYDPYIDVYGQNVFTTWPTKIATDSDLAAAVTAEQTWLLNNGPLGGLDSYGGSLLAGWTEKATGYYYTAQHNNRWWLI